MAREVNANTEAFSQAGQAAVRLQPATPPVTPKWLEIWTLWARFISKIWKRLTEWSPISEPYQTVLDYGHMAEQAENYLKEKAPHYMRRELAAFILKLREAEKNASDEESDRKFLREVMRAIGKVEGTIPPRGGIDDEFGDWSESMIEASDVLFRGEDKNMKEWLTNRPRGGNTR